MSTNKTLSDIVLEEAIVSLEEQGITIALLLEDIELLVERQALSTVKAFEDRNDIQYDGIGKFVIKQTRTELLDRKKELQEEGYTTAQLSKILAEEGYRIRANRVRRKRAKKEEKANSNVKPRCKNDRPSLNIM